MDRSKKKDAERYVSYFDELLFRSEIVLLTKWTSTNGSRSGALTIKDYQFHNNHELNFFGFSIGSQVEAEHVLNRLWIGKAQRTDSGNYSCTIPEHSPEEFPRARVRVHVMDGNYLLNLCIKIWYILRRGISSPVSCSIFNIEYSSCYKTLSDHLTKIFIT